jgi:P pilus assembly chaperone PapD
MRRVILSLILALVPPLAHAEFSITSAIVEFTQDGPRQQDIELVSRSDGNDYIVSEVYEVMNPGEANEERRLVKDPTTSMLLVTPDRTVLAGNGRRILRFVLLRDLDDKEHVYRVAIKPVIKGVDNDHKVGLKILVGYEALVIMRPAVPMPAFSARRDGKMVEVANTGNTGILFQNGQQCVPGENEDKKMCKLPPAVRIYAGQRAKIELPRAAPVTYSIWDGRKSDIKTIQ